MIKMVDRQQIIHMYRTRGYSKRAIARELDINRKTVSKVIAEYEATLESSDRESSLETLLSCAPRYNSSGRSRRVITGVLKDLIDDCLQKNIQKRSIGLKKQCMLGKDIYEFVLDKGFKVSYSGVCKYIKESNSLKKDQSSEAFVRGYYPPGEACEFDWGEVKLYLGGKLQRLYMGVFTFSHSNGRYAWLFRHQDTLAFMESHRNFFAQVHGVPDVMVYDNMRVAIKEFVGAEKRPTDALLRLSNFYRYHYRFCNIRAGWEKGHVERSVEYVRRKAFCVNLRFNTLEDAQEQLMTTCERMNKEVGSPSTSDKQVSLAADLAALTYCSNEMGCFEWETFKVDKWSTICKKGSHYSVPDTLVGKMVEVKVYSEKLVVVYNKEKQAVHERIYGTPGWSVKLEHYLRTLLRKPGAVHGSLALRQMPKQIQELFNRQFGDKPKDFVFLLQYAHDHGFTDQDILMAYQDLKKRGLRSVSADQIKTLMHALTESEPDSNTVQHPQIREEQSTDIEEGAFKILMDLSQIMDNQGTFNNNTYKH